MAYNAAETMYFKANHIYQRLINLEGFAGGDLRTVLLDEGVDEEDISSMISSLSRLDAQIKYMAKYLAEAEVTVSGGG